MGCACLLSYKELSYRGSHGRAAVLTSCSVLVFEENCHLVQELPEP